MRTESEVRLSVGMGKAVENCCVYMPVGLR